MNSMNRPARADLGTYPPQAVPGAEQLVDVAGVLRWIVRQWLFMLGGALLGLVLGLVYLRVATYTYTVTMKVTPVGSPQTASSGRLSQLANIAGVNIGGLTGGEGNFEIFLDGLTSRRTATAMSTDVDLLRRLFPDEWSPETRSWQRPATLANMAKDLGDTLIGRETPPYTGPTPADVENRLGRIVKVAEGQDSMISTVTVNVEDPEFGKELLAFLSDASNADLRDRSKARSEAYIAYLEQAVAETTVAEQRAAYVQILSDQAKVLMIAGSGLPYAADRLEPPFASRRPTLPNPILILLLGLIGGSLLGLLAAAGLARRSRPGATGEGLDTPA